MVPEKVRNNLSDHLITHDLKDSLTLSLHQVEIYSRSTILEIEDETNPSDRRSRMQLPLSKLTSTSSGDIRACVGSIHEMLNSFGALLERGDTLAINNFPPFYFGRVVSGLTSLIMLQPSGASLDSSIGGSLPAPVCNICAESHLTRLLKALDLAPGDELRLPVQNFQVQLRMLRPWAEGMQKSGGGASGRTLETPNRKTRPPHHPLGSKPASTHQLPPYPADPDWATPRMGYRKLSVLSGYSRCVQIDRTASSRHRLPAPILDYPHEQPHLPNSWNLAGWSIDTSLQGRFDPNATQEVGAAPRPYPTSFAAPHLGNLDFAYAELNSQEGTSWDSAGMALDPALRANLVEHMFVEGGEWYFQE
jgi:hypothetical protein